MPSLTVETRPSQWMSEAEPLPSALHRYVRALVVSPRLEVRQPLMRTLETLAMDVIACATRSEAEEVLSRQTVDLIFCDDRLPEGSYADLISTRSGQAGPRVIVATRTGEWDLYLEALSKGAFDVVRCPWHSTDIELAVIRALRETKPLAAAAAA
jgi:DNA-binding NtrC family response regulator